MLITSYRVSLLLPSLSFVDICTTGATECLMPLQDFLEDPYNFVQGDQLRIVVTASNVLGEGQTSFLSSTTVALMETLPHKPLIELTVDSLNTNREQIKVVWG